jgi:hypothetical protein
MLTITDSALESEPNLLNKKFDYVRKVYTQGPRRNANQPTSGHLKTIRHPNAAKEMPIYPMQFEQCKRILRPNAAKESNLPDAIRTMKEGFAVPMPLKEFRLKKTPAMLWSLRLKNAAKKGYAENMLRPSLNAGKMAGWYSEIAQKCWKSGLAAMRFMEIGWTRELVAGLQWVVRREGGFSCIRRVRPRPRRRHRDCASGVRCILLALSRLVRCSRRGRRQPCWRIGVL